MPKFNHISNIPAETFFEILKTKNYQLLKPKQKEQDLEAVFLAIYDDFFLQSDNSDAKEFLRLRNEIASYTYQISVLEQTLLFYTSTPHTAEMRLDAIKAIKKGFGIDIDIEKDFLDEVQRVLNTHRGYLRNNLNMAQMAFDELIKTAQNKDFNYYEQLAVLGQNLPNNPLLNGKISLALYVELEKLAQKLNSKKK